MFCHFLLHLAPSKPPSPVNVLNKTSTTVLVKWSPIPQNLVHGILLGYHIHFKNVNPVGFGDVSPDIQSVRASNTSFLMQRLLKFTEYTIQVSGYTVKGDGPLSNAVSVITEEDGKTHKASSGLSSINCLFKHSLGPIYTVRFLSHATSLREAYDMTYDWCVRQKNVAAF